MAGKALVPFLLALLVRRCVVKEQGNIARRTPVPGTALIMG